MAIIIINLAIRLIKNDFQVIWGSMQVQLFYHGFSKLATVLEIGVGA